MLELLRGRVKEREYVRDELGRFAEVDAGRIIGTYDAQGNYTATVERETVPREQLKLAGMGYGRDIKLDTLTVMQKPEFREKIPAILSELGARSGMRERGVILDKHGNTVVDMIGKETEVNFPAREFMEGKGGVLMHSHPYDMGPSAGDILAMASGNMQAMFAAYGDHAWVIEREGYSMPRARDLIEPLQNAWTSAAKESFDDVLAARGMEHTSETEREIRKMYAEQEGTQGPLFTEINQRTTDAFLSRVNEMQGMAVFRVDGIPVSEKPTETADVLRHINEMDARRRAMEALEDDEANELRDAFNEHLDAKKETSTITPDKHLSPLSTPEEVRRHLEETERILREAGEELGAKDVSDPMREYVRDELGRFAEAGTGKLVPVDEAQRERMRLGARIVEENGKLYERFAPPRGWHTQKSPTGRKIASDMLMEREWGAYIGDRPLTGSSYFRPEDRTFVGLHDESGKIGNARDMKHDYLAMTVMGFPNVFVPVEEEGYVRVTVNDTGVFLEGAKPESVRSAVGAIIQSGVDRSTQVSYDVHAAPDRKRISGQSTLAEALRLGAKEREYTRDELGRFAETEGDRARSVLSGVDPAVWDKYIMQELEKDWPKQGGSWRWLMENTDSRNGPWAKTQVLIGEIKGSAERGREIYNSGHTDPVQTHILAAIETATQRQLEEAGVPLKIPLYRGESPGSPPYRGSGVSWWTSSPEYAARYAGPEGKVYRGEVDRRTVIYTSKSGHYAAQLGRHDVADEFFVYESKQVEPTLVEVDLSSTPSEVLAKKSWLQRLFGFKREYARDEVGRFAETDGGHISRGAAGRLTKLLEAKGGFTYSTLFKRSPKEGMVLSLQPKREKVIEGRKTTMADLDAYIGKNRDLLAEPKNYVGGWKDGESGRIYLDITTIVDSHAEAESLAREYKQEAYYDLAAGQEVRVRAREDNKAATGHASAQPDARREAALSRLPEWRGRVRADGAGRKAVDRLQQRARITSILYDQDFWDGLRRKAQRDSKSLFRELYAGGVEVAFRLARHHDFGVKAKNDMTPLEQRALQRARIDENRLFNEWWDRMEASARSELTEMLDPAIFEDEGGVDIEAIGTRIAEVFGDERVKKVAITETTRIMGHAAQATYEMLGAEEWEWRTAEDDLVCAVCDAMKDNAPYPIDEQFEPAHVRCRCWPVPVPGEEEDDVAEKQLLTTLVGYRERDYVRDDQGRFAEVSGSGAAVADRAMDRMMNVPSIGSMNPRGPFRRVDTADEALAAIAKGEFVELDPEKFGVVLEKMHDMAQEAKALGKDAPNYDLCNVSVEGTLFCAENMGVARIEMPQITDREGFVDHLHSLKVGHADVFVDAAKLKATQREIDGVKVAGMMVAAEEGKFDLKGERIFVSSDNYVLDGHHRWAAMVGLDWTSDMKLGGMDMPVTRINLPVSALLPIANEYVDEHGLQRTGFGKGVGAVRFLTGSGRTTYRASDCFKEWSEDMVTRDELGRFSDGGASMNVTAVLDRPETARSLEDLMGPALSYDGPPPGQPGALQAAAAVHPFLIPGSPIPDTLPPIPGAVTVVDTPEIIAERAEWAKLGNISLPPEKVEQYAKQMESEDGVVRQERIATMVFGLTASAKSTLVADVVAADLGARLADSDISKGIIGYGEGITTGPDGEPIRQNGADGAAGILNNASREVNDLYVERALERGDNIVWPKIGDKYDRVIEDLQTLKDNGYTTKVFLVDIPAVEGARRSVVRYYEQERFVDPAVNVFQADSKPPATYDRLKQEHPELVNDGFTKINNAGAFGQHYIVEGESVEEYLERIGSDGRTIEAGTREMARQAGQQAGDGESAGRGNRLAFLVGSRERDYVRDELGRFAETDGATPASAIRDLGVMALEAKLAERVDALARLEEARGTPQEGDRAYAKFGIPQREYEKVKLPPELPGPSQYQVNRVDNYVVEKIAEVQDEIIARHGQPPSFDDVERTAVEGMRAYIDNSDVAIRMPIGVLADVVMDGEVKNQHETGSSGGMLAPGLREQVEKAAFGIPRERDPSDYPVYGYLQPRTRLDEDIAGQYGDVRVILNDDVKDRTTFNIGDSLGAVADFQVQPVLVREPTIYAADAQIYETIDREASHLGELTPRDPRAQTTVNYWETQIHGGVKLEDIARVDLPATATARTGVDKMAESLRDAGAQVRILQMEYSGETGLLEPVWVDYETYRSAAS